MIMKETESIVGFQIWWAYKGERLSEIHKFLGIFASSFLFPSSILMSQSFPKICNDFLHLLLMSRFLL